MNANPSLPYYEAIAQQRGDAEALRIAADDIDKLRTTLAELKALQVNGFDPIAAARSYPELVDRLRACATISDALFHLAVNGHLMTADEKGRLLKTLETEVPRMYDTARNADNFLRHLGEVA